MSIEVKELTKRFGPVPAVDGVSLSVAPGALTALLGPSGSGKTTVLRTIAGLETPDAGSIWIDGVEVTGVPARKRDVGLVFQHYALFKHMKVTDNIAFPLKVRHWPRGKIRERVAELVALLRLDGLEKRYPAQLSGGQRQRVALARALASHPKVLLLDEPFSALDARVREELREWLRRLHDELHVTSLFVTHDQGEAMELAECVVILNEGKVVQAGAPEQVFWRPESAFVMNFLGQASVLRGEATQGVAELAGLRVPYPEANGHRTPVVGYVRPHDLVLSRLPAGDDSIAATVLRVIPTGPTYKVQVVTRDSDEVLVAHLPADAQQTLDLRAGDPIYATPRDVRVYTASDYTI
jgi:sulfate transport system ATP-binding protein